MTAPSPLPPLSSGPRKRTLLIIVVAVAAVAVVAGYLVMVLFVSNATQLQPGGKPLIVLSAPSVRDVGTSWYIAGMSPATDHSKFQVGLLVNGTPTTTAFMAEGGQAARIDLNTGGFAEVYYVTWFDATQDGLVSKTDTFTVSGLDGFRPASDYAFQILWTDGSLVVRSDFST